MQPAEAAPATVERLDMPRDLPVSFVRGADGKPPHIVFLPGICSNAWAYLASFAASARAQGGAVAIDGDRPCGDSRDFHSISSDPSHEEPRIEAALRRAGVASPESTPVILVGYSLGAILAEKLVQRAPERYSEVVLMGSPRDLELSRLRGAKAVATMSCSLDVPGRMKKGARSLGQIGVRAAYFEMPGCTHGNIADGDRVFDEVFAFLAGPEPS
jgi:pimeloyl-ACP methyl ester carboxylesterase